MINLQQKITDSNFVEMEDATVKQDGTTTTDGFLTLEKVCCRSVLTCFDDKEPIQKKDQRYRLWQKLVGQKEVKLKSEEITLLKEQISKAYTTLVYGQTADMLEGEEAIKLVDKL